MKGTINVKVVTPPPIFDIRDTHSLIQLVNEVVTILGDRSQINVIYIKNKQNSFFSVYSGGTMINGIFLDSVTINMHNKFVKFAL